jgi:hypothetical protein
MQHYFTFRWIPESHINAFFNHTWQLGIHEETTNFNLDLPENAYPDNSSQWRQEHRLNNDVTGASLYNSKLCYRVKFYVNYPKSFTGFFNNYLTAHIFNTIVGDQDLYNMFLHCKSYFDFSAFMIDEVQSEKTPLGAYWNDSNISAAQLTTKLKTVQI